MASVPAVNENGLSQRDVLYVSKSKTTFCNDESLPSLPVPPLEQTIEKYLDSVKALVSEEEYKKTEEICQEFKEGIGKELQWKLLERANHQRNWLEKWWDELAYLQQRAPLIPMCSMAGLVDVDSICCYEPGKQVNHAAMYLFFQLSFWKLLQKERLRPYYSHDTPWTMHQFRRLFNTARVPGETSDKIVSYFHTESEGTASPSHVIILHHGHIFTFDAVDEFGEILKLPELALQLQRIKDWAKVNEYGSSVACLTTTDRTEWAKNVDWLVKLHPENAQNLETINSSVLALTMDDAEPKDQNETFNLVLAGDCSNRWADKSVLDVVFSNGAFGLVSDHTPFDGLVPVALGHYTYISIVECDGKWKESDTVKRQVLPPRRIDFHIDDHIKSAIKLAREEYNVRADDVDATRGLFTQYGKAFMKTCKIHPETYVQLALQYAYCVMHGKLAPTYVTASTRQFYHGRTETLRACYPEVAEWINAMIEDTKTVHEKKKLLQAASDKFRILMKDCMQNHGCDRHLLGLYMIAVEEDMPVPEIFIDPSWVKSGGSGNFVLSTSCNGFTPVYGGVMPMREDGYGAFYSIIDDRITFTLTSFKHCQETNTAKFFQHTEKALMDLKHLFTASKISL